jgi:hypothetical protein
MFFLIHIPNIMFLVTIPEPIELFAFGVVLVVAVGALRSFLNRATAEKADEEVTNN